LKFKIAEAEATNKAYKPCEKDLGKKVELIDIDPRAYKLLEWCKKKGYI
jgi:hypothetical protein